MLFELSDSLHVPNSDAFHVLCTTSINPTVVRFMGRSRVGMVISNTEGGYKVQAISINVPYRGL